MPLPKLYGTEKDWQTVADNSPAAWKGTLDSLFQTGDRLVQAIKGFQDERLHEIVPGRQYDFYYLLHGIVQHSLHHAGQIAMLKRQLRSAWSLPAVRNLPSCNKDAGPSCVLWRPPFALKTV